MLIAKILTPILPRPLSGRARSLLACGALLLAAGAAQAQSTPSRADAALLDMQQAFRKGDSKQLTALLPLVRNHPLEVWGAYWELKARLESASAAEIRDFLTRYSGSYQEDRLRNDWLLLLGQHRDWATFAAEYPFYRMGDDREVRCYALALDFMQKGTDTSAEVRRSWYAQREAGDGCALAADKLHQGGKLGDLDIWRKARLAMELGQIRATRMAVAMVSPELDDAIPKIADQPEKYLQGRIVALRTPKRELVVLALVAIAAEDYARAAVLLDNKWATQLTPEERNWVWGTIGKQAASRLADSALVYFANVTRLADLTDDMLAWRARAALRQGDWKTVQASIRAMSESTRNEPVWAYWHARALLAQLPERERALVQQAPGTEPNAPHRRAELVEARQLLEGIAGPQGFYEVLAQEELGQRLQPPARPMPLSAPEKYVVRQNPSLQRAMQAIALGLRPEGVREWNYATNLHTKGGLSERELLAAADMACEAQLWDRCINTSDRTKTQIDIEQRYPQPYRDTILARSRQAGIDAAYVYGLMRQESRFVADARSGVGAAGLMQVMPPTARWTAKKIGMGNISPEQLTDRDTNITIGTHYLKLVLDSFDGSMPLAAAAYNAGPTRSRSWRNGPVLEGAIWTENVPFGETRDYVKKVLLNTTMYAALLSGQPQSLKARLGSVGPRSAQAAADLLQMP